MWRRALMSQRIPGCRGRGDIMPKAQLWLFLPRYCSALITTAALKAFWGWNPYVQSYRFSGIIHVQRLWQTLIPQEAGGFSRASLSLFSSSYSSPPPPNSNQNNKSIRKNKKTTKHIFCFSRNGLQCYKKCCIKSLVHLILYFSLLQYIVCSSG